MLPTFHLSALAWLPCAAMLLSSPVAMAQSVTRADPASAAAAVPPLTYESPLARYRAYADQAVAPWRETNDTAARIGGWRAYARETSEPADEAAAKATSQPAPAPAVSGTNHMHQH